MAFPRAGSCVSVRKHENKNVKNTFVVTISGILPRVIAVLTPLLSRIDIRTSLFIVIHLLAGQIDVIMRFIVADHNCRNKSTLHFAMRREFSISI